MLVSLSSALPELTWVKYATDAGLDLRVTQAMTIMPGESVVAPSHLTVEWIATGFHLEIRPKSSGLAKGLLAGSGVIDTEYRGQIFVQLFVPFAVNGVKTKVVVLEAGAPVAQLVIYKTWYPDAQIFVDGLPLPVQYPDAKRNTDAGVARVLNGEQS